MRALEAYRSDSEQIGFFRVFAQPPGGYRREITMFRDAPVVVSGVSFGDPFSEKTAQLSLPQVTAWDSLGSGDTDWIVPDCDIDIVWENTGNYWYDWRWEGYIASMNFDSQGTQSQFSLELKGAFYGLDDYLATPSFPKRPIPYEILISQAFNQDDHPAHLGEFRMTFPEDWGVRVPEYDSAEYLSFLKPWGVTTGQLWTGFTSRSTGSWEPLLSGHVQSLLSVMFAEGGAQWTIRNLGHRRPELYLRRIPESNDGGIIEVTLGAPGVDFTGSQDFTQRANVIFGQGVDEAGISYSGMTVSNDGKSTLYRPFAYDPRMWPVKGNPNFSKRAKPKQTMIRFQDGVDELSARNIAQGQYQRFSEPGITGTITLRADARYADGELAPRLLIRAGQSIRLNGFRGLDPGPIFHITDASVDLTALTTTLQVDTKYRDMLTVDEVRARTRDALTPLRALQVGKYSNTVQDLVLPWSYKEGSGCIPLASREFFNEKLPSNATFPYEEWTRKHPPKDPASRPYYIKLGKVKPNNSTKNWTGVARDGQAIMSIPIRMAQNGTIRLTQLAAYDKDGNVKPVRFHFSVYSNNGVVTNAMPKFGDDPETTGIKYLRPADTETNYEAFQANPFFEGAWESVNPDGTLPGEIEQQYRVPDSSAGLVAGWGTYYEPAGYSPGRFSRGASRTGLLVDEAPWTWDLSSLLDMYSPENNANQEYAGMLFIQIFCDDHGDEPVYFLGRLFRQEPGAS